MLTVLAAPGRGLVVGFHHLHFLLNSASLSPWVGEEKVVVVGERDCLSLREVAGREDGGSSALVLLCEGRAGHLAGPP